ncbi:hypothetical protein OG985_31455 [Streptomyces sp. NBC_00289]|uniref:hypothetical protein n=1 Tax=Streptomyces sp. NBC_00289 TaxID=2975703 RepID=UPI003243EEC5
MRIDRTAPLPQPSAASAGCPENAEHLDVPRDELGQLRHALWSFLWSRVGPVVRAAEVRRSRGAAAPRCGAAEVWRGR